MEVTLVPKEIISKCAYNANEFQCSLEQSTKIDILHLP